LAIDPALDQLSREELIVRARALGARRPEVMTRLELRDEIVRLGEADPTVRRRTRGWLGVARDLVASVVDSGLNLPGAAAAIRGEGKPEHEWQGPPPVATLTLAEIYVAQGHTDRALAVLAEVLSNEPDHAAALALRDRIERRGEPQRVPPAARVAPETEEATPGRPIQLTEPIDAEVVAEIAADAEVPSEPLAADAEVPSEPLAADAEVPSEPLAADAEVPSEPLAADGELRSDVPPEDEPPLVPPPPAPPVEAAVPEGETFGSEEAPTPNPFPDEPSPLTADHSILPDEAPVYGEEKTVRGVLNLLPERPACAVVATSRGVEAFYELPMPAVDAVLRVVWFTPLAGGVERGERDVAVEPGYHRVTVDGVAPSSEVRAAIGTVTPGGFAPLAVAWVYREGSGAPTLAFAPPGEEPPTLRARVEARIVALR
jgi:hypothetical protein